MAVKTAYNDGGVAGMLEMLKNEFDVVPLNAEDDRDHV